MGWSYLPMQIKAFSTLPWQYRKRGSSRTTLLREPSQDLRAPRPSTAGARVYTRDALAQPVCQGAPTQDTLVVAKVTTPIWFDLIPSPPITSLSKSVRNPTATLRCVPVQLRYCCSDLDKEFGHGSRSKAAFFYSISDLLTSLVHKSQVTTHMLEDKKLRWITETINYIRKGHSFFGKPIKSSSYVDSTFTNTNRRPLHRSFQTSWKLTLKVLFVFCPPSKV